MKNSKPKGHVLVERGDVVTDSGSMNLRAVGPLDRKPDTKLLFASNRGQEAVILYEKGGVRRLEEYPISTIYEVWVKEYVKRKNFLASNQVHE